MRIAAVALAASLAACVPSGSNPSPAHYEPPVAPGIDASPDAGATCEQAQSVLQQYACKEAYPGPDVVRKDGTIHHGKSFVEVCHMAQQDGLMMQATLQCLVSSVSLDDAKACGFCRN